MNYQVWIKEGSEWWKRKDCEDLPSARGEILTALKCGAEPLLTVEVPFSVNIEVKEGKLVEVTTSKASPGEGPGAESTSEV